MHNCALREYMRDVHCRMCDGTVTIWQKSPDAMLMRVASRSKIKTRLETAYGEWVERIPAWIKWATQVRTVHMRILPSC